MKQITALAISSVIGLSLATSSIASGKLCETSGKLSESSPQLAEFLFARAFTGATLTHTHGQDYNLSVALSQASPVTAMAISPTKTVAYLTAKEYEKIVHSGKDSFDKIPPNLFLHFKGYPITPYTLTGYEKTKTQLTYHLHLIGKEAVLQKPITGEAILIIDNKMLGVG